MGLLKRFAVKTPSDQIARPRRIDTAEFKDSPIRKK